MEKKLFRTKFKTMSDEETDEIHGWVKLETEDGKPYFYHPNLNLTQWDEPEEGFQTVDPVEEEEVEEEVEEEAAFEEEVEEEAVVSSENVAYEEEEEEEEEEVNSYTEADAEPSSSWTSSGGGGDDEEQRDPSSSSSSSSSLTKSRRRICRWELKQTASFGAGTGKNAGDVYYLNKETGETVWEEPDDFFDDSVNANPQIIITLAPIDEETTLSSGFDVLDLYGEDAQHELELLRSGDLSAAEACLKRLNYLEQLFQNVGTEEEWFDTIMEDEYALAGWFFLFFLFFLYSRSICTHARFSPGHFLFFFFFFVCLFVCYTQPK